ncbi:MAG: L-rhamnose mutarotase [Acidobacteria bacterium]|nr:L-rhamnose mutarotase [Acidobacteriota bacterium]
MKTYCLALDLKDDSELIAEYLHYHQPEGIWPEVAEQIKKDGVLSEQIYKIGTRMVMVLNTTDDFSFEAKSASNKASPVMQQWEALMDKYQQKLPEAGPGDKWVLMEKIFEI